MAGPVRLFFGLRERAGKEFEPAITLSVSRSDQGSACPCGEAACVNFLKHEQGATVSIGSEDSSSKKG